jgi:hypothetical protein
MWTYRFLPTTLHQRCLIAVRPTLINLRALPLDKAFHPPKLPGSLTRQPKGMPFKDLRTSASTTLTAILDVVRALDATVFSIGLGNTVSDCIDWPSSILRET